MNTEQIIFQALDKLLTIGGGILLVNWVKERFSKIDDIDKRITKLENFEEFKEKHLKKD